MIWLIPWLLIALGGYVMCVHSMDTNPLLAIVSGVICGIGVVGLLIGSLTVGIAAL